jgi:hypothetical protein
MGSGSINGFSCIFEHFLFTWHFWILLFGFFWEARGYWNADLLIWRFGVTFFFLGFVNQFTKER